MWKTNAMLDEHEFYVLCLEGSRPVFIAREFDGDNVFNRKFVQREAFMRTTEIFIRMNLLFAMSAIKRSFIYN